MKAMASSEETVFAWVFLGALCIALNLSGCSPSPTECIPINQYEYSPGCNQGVSIALEYRPCEDLLIAMKDEQLFSSADFGKTWSPAQEAIIYPYGITDYGCHPLNRGVRYRIVNEKGMPFPVGCKYLEKSTDFGRTWTRQNAKLEDQNISLSPRAIYYNNRDPNTIYIRPVQTLDKEYRTTFCVSHDGGNTFRQILSIKGHLFAVSPSNPDILYAADVEGNVLTSTDGGLRWTAILSGSKMRSEVAANAIRQAIVHDESEIRGFQSVALTVDPRSSATAYIVTEYGILRTTDGGQTWCGVKAEGLAGSTYDLLIDPKDTKTLCLGTECGLFRSTNGGADWKKIDLAYK